jgi:hypothetical protein
MTEPSVEQFHSRVDAVLSQNLIQQGKNLRQTDPTALYQTGNQLDVTNRCTVNRTSAIVVAFFISDWFRQTVLMASASVQILLLYLAFFAPIIFTASLYGVFAPMSLPAAERTAKVSTPCIARMGEK